MCGSFKIYRLVFSFTAAAISSAEISCRNLNITEYFTSISNHYTVSTEYFIYIQRCKTKITHHFTKTPNHFITNTEYFTTVRRCKTKITDHFTTTPRYFIATTQHFIAISKHHLNITPHCKAEKGFAKPISSFEGAKSSLAWVNLLLLVKNTNNGEKTISIT